MSAHRLPVLVVTRPAPAGARFAQEAVRGLGASAVVSPLMRIDPVEPEPLPAHIGGVIFSSSNAVARAGALGLAVGLPAYCVGPRTTAEAREAGFAAEEAGPTAETLVTALAGRALAGPLVHLRGRHGRGDVAARLSAAGQDCSERVVYDQVALPLDDAARAALSGEAPVVLPLFSPRSARLVAEQAGPGGARHVVAISPDVARAAAALGAATLDQADMPDGDAMLRATRARLGWLESRGVAG